MSTLRRRLTFLTRDLGRNATLVLTFDDANNTSKYQDAFSVVWRTGSFGMSGQQAFTVEYRSEFGFISGLTAPLGIVYAYTHINPGEKTILTEGGDPPAHYFSTPTPVQPVTRQMVAENDARDRVNIGFGIFEKSDRPPAQTIFVENVNRRSTVEFEQPSPTLLGYVTTSSEYNYKEGEILRSAIPYPVIFTENLAALNDETYWKLEMNPATGVFTITRSP